MSDGVELFDGVGRDSDVKGELEESFGTFDESFLKRFGIIKGGLSASLRDTSSFNIRVNFSFHFGDATTKIIKSVFGVRREDVHRNVKRVIKVNERREPVGGNVTRIADDKEGTEVLILDLDVTEVYFDVGRSNNVSNGRGLLT